MRYTLIEATEIVIGDTIEWLEYPPYRWARGEVLAVKIKPSVDDDSLKIRCIEAKEHLPQLNVGDIARRKMDRLRIAKVFRFSWDIEEARDQHVAWQRKKRERAVSAALRYYRKKGSV